MGKHRKNDDFPGLINQLIAYLFIQGWVYFLGPGNIWQFTSRRNVFQTESGGDTRLLGFFPG